MNVRQSVSARARRTRAQSEGCQYKDFGESNRAAYSNAQRWLDGELADGRAFIAGDTLSMADICALSTVDFAHWIGLDLDPDRPHLSAWHERIAARPSASA